MTARSRILLTGGGTAGHVNPALAIGRSLGDEQTRFLYVGVRGRAEADVVPREGMPIKFVRASAYPGARPSVRWIAFLLNLLVGTLKSLVIVAGFRPDIIVGTGGFASAPVMLAAAILRRLGLCRARIYVHEQNAAPGKLNLLVGRLADRVFLSFPDTLASFPGNGLMVGYPLRQRIRVVDRGAARAALDFGVPEGRTVVFAFGGSQGARTINQAVVDALGDLLPQRDRLYIVHGTGLRKADGGYDGGADVAERLRSRYSESERQHIESFYVARPFFHQIEQVYALADLVVVRAGAGTLNEIAALGVPAIVVPKAGLPGDHQVANARALARTGGAVVLYETTRRQNGAPIEQLDGAQLAATILQLTGSGRLTDMGRAIRGFIQQDALVAIGRAVAEDEGDGGEADGQQRSPMPQPAASAPADPLLGNAALVAQLERSARQQGANYRVEREVPAADDRAYYISRAVSLVAAARWESRNVGIKLMGLLQARDQVAVVLAILADRTPAAWYKRVVGGDFEQVGFIRRNALTTLARLGVVTPDVEAALLAAFSDPYYEARSEAAHATAALEASLSAGARPKLVAALIAGLKDPWLEVAAASAAALGRVGGETDALPALLELQTFKFWVVRAAGLRGLLSLVERGRAGDLAVLERRVRGFVLTATDFRPEFTIRSSYVAVLAALAKHRSAGA